MSAPPLKVNGERNPAEVYNDFRSSVLQILSAHRTPISVTVPNGNAVPVQHLEGEGVEHLDGDGVNKSGGKGINKSGDGVVKKSGDERRSVDGDSKRQRADLDTEPLSADRDAEWRPINRDVKRLPTGIAVVHAPSLAKTVDSNLQPLKYPTVVCVMGECGKK